jgi:hypothetical protein
MKIEFITQFDSSMSSGFALHWIGVEDALYFDVSRQTSRRSGGHAKSTWKARGQSFLRKGFKLELVYG